MARFTDENKWEDKWFRKLSVGQKLIFLYLCDKCNLAGFIEWDPEFAQFQIGVESDKIEGALKGLARGLVIKGEYIWIKNFLKHQKNAPLNPNNPAHKNIIRCIDDRKEFHKEIEELYGPLKPLFRGIGIGKGKGSSKGKGYKESEELSQNAERIYQIYPKHVSKPAAIIAIKKALQIIDVEELAEKVSAFAKATKGANTQFIAYPATWFNRQSWTDDPEMWELVGRDNSQLPEEEEEDLDSTLDNFRGGK